MPGCGAILCGRRPSTPLTLSLSKGQPLLHVTSPFGLDIHMDYPEPAPAAH